MLLHDCRCYNDGNAEGGDNADEHECHLPLLDERNNESGKEHCDGMNSQCYLLGDSIYNQTKF